MVALDALPDLEAMERQREAVRELAGHIYSAQAELALQVARLDYDGAWAGEGYRSIAHWLSMHLGMGLISARDLVRVGHALTELPKVADAFAAGTLSYDKVRFICLVANPQDQEVWVELAQTISGSQLIRICLAYKRAKAAASPHQADAHMARRGLWTFREDDGMVRLIALLPPDDAALVMTALDSVSSDPLVPIDDTSLVPDPAEDRWAARRVDSFVDVFKHAMAEKPEGLVSATDPTQLVVYVDVGVLTGEDPEGRCHLEDGTPLSAAAAQRLGCDASVVPITEKDGLPIDVGRGRRFFTKPQCRALRARDRGCRFPGCGVPPGRTSPHHLVPWYLGGLTDLDNGLSLCGWHHRRLHDGEYRIQRSADRSLRFETHDGRLIEPPPPRLDPASCGAPHLREQARQKGAHIDAMTPMALDPGSPLDHSLAVEMLIHNDQLRQARAGPAPG